MDMVTRKWLKIPSGSRDIQPVLILKLDYTMIKGAIVDILKLINRNITVWSLGMVATILDPKQDCYK